MKRRDIRKATARARRRALARRERREAAAARKVDQLEDHVENCNECETLEEANLHLAGEL